MAKAYKTYSYNVKKNDVANIEEAGDANTLDNNDFPDEDAGEAGQLQSNDQIQTEQIKQSGALYLLNLQEVCRWPKMWLLTRQQSSKKLAQPKGAE